MWYNSKLFQILVKWILKDEGADRPGGICGITPNYIRFW